MYTPSFMAFLHHVGAFALTAAIAVQMVTFKPPFTRPLLRRLLVTDLVAGLSATLLLIVGLLRVHFFEKGAAYYFSNPFFLAKLALFLLAAAISIYPTLVVRSWRRRLDGSDTPQLPVDVLERVRLCLMLELAAILAILLLAPLMADGLGHVG